MSSTYTLQIAVCEDAAQDAARLEAYIEKTGIPSECVSFASGESFLRAFRAGRYDLVFLDIYLSGASGVQIAQIIRKTDRNVILAFTTSSLEYTLDGYRVGALKYLEKPVAAEEVKETLELALLKRTSRTAITLLMAGGKYADVPLDSIIYFEQKGHTVMVYTSSEILMTGQAVKMDDIEKRLPTPPFLRCHRSYIVNLDYVRKADREIHAFIMKNGHRADIRRGGFAKHAETLKLWVMEKTGRNEI